MTHQSVSLLRSQKSIQQTHGYFVAGSVGLQPPYVCKYRPLIFGTCVDKIQRNQTSSCQEVTINQTYLLDNRVRLSKLWIPTGGTAISPEEDSHAKLVRAGFLRQAHSGIYHMLPLGRRVQCKLEALIDRHMSHIAEANRSLKTINVINIIGGALVQKWSPREGKLRARKYRDEPRPRHGLFRSREFTMKDLYTFDCSPSLALSTYHTVRAVYSNIFKELKLPYLEAEADSGDMGGSLSHEFHFPTPKGEDRLLTCSMCNYVANEEFVQTDSSERHKANTKITHNQLLATKVHVWRGISKDRSTLVNIWYGTNENTQKIPDSKKVNFHAIKDVFSDFDSSVDDTSIYYSKNASSASLNCKNLLKNIRRIVNMFDSSVPVSTIESLKTKNLPLSLLPPSLFDLQNKIKVENILEHPSTGKRMELMRRQDGDPCPFCVNGSLKIYKAIELAHTFYLGTRYCRPLMASIPVPVDIIERFGMVPDEDSDNNPKKTRKVPMQMGCHGIGVSRMIGAVAEILMDEKGLNWPRVMAPYDVVIICSKGLDAGAEEVYDQLNVESSSATKIDLALDDRELSFPWKMQDADLIGYPVIVIVGRRWESKKVCEVQCRRLKFLSEVSIGDLSSLVNSLLEQL